MRGLERSTERRARLSQPAVGKAIYIDKILPNSEAARLEKAGKIKEGDEITMVSATFGDEMWSAKGIGKYRLEKSIAVRQGMTISFVVEGSDKDDKKRMKELAEKQSKEQARVARLQKMLTDEVKDEKKKVHASPSKQTRPALSDTATQPALLPAYNCACFAGTVWAVVDCAVRHVGPLPWLGGTR
jgi:hypothetical protein